MSSNRLIYDDCAKSKQDIIDKNQLNWILDSGRYINDNNCLIEEQFFGKAGNDINNNNFMNRVDLETQLWGIDNKDSSKCKQPTQLNYESANSNTCNFMNLDQSNNSNMTANIINNEQTNSELTNKTCS